MTLDASEWCTDSLLRKVASSGILLSSFISTRKAFDLVLIGGDAAVASTASAVAHPHATDGTTAGAALLAFSVFRESIIGESSEGSSCGALIRSSLAHFERRGGNGEMKLQGRWYG